MRIVFASLPIYSHLVPVVAPVAAAAQRAGHEVVIATSATMADQIAALGLPHLPLPNVPSWTQLGADRELAQRFGVEFLIDFGPFPRDPHRSVRNMIQLYTGRVARKFAEDLTVAADSWGGDVVVRESTALGAYLAAERLRLPHAVLDIAPFAPVRSAPVIDALNRHTLAWGLPRITHPAQMSGVLRAAILPEAWYPPSLRDSRTRYYRHDLTLENEGSELDPRLAGLSDDRPLILASLGSNAQQLLPDDRPVLDMLIKALAGINCTGVVPLGKRRSPDTWAGQRADNVQLTSFVQQRKLLSACDVFISHGGFSGIRETLTAGVPVVVIPLFAEQPANADRIAQLGAGLQLDIGQTSADSLTAACEEILGDRSFAYRAKGFHRKALGLPGLDRFVQDLEVLVG